jgi:hypothetical protein
VDIYSSCFSIATLSLNRYRFVGNIDVIQAQKKRLFEQLQWELWSLLQSLQESWFPLHTFAYQIFAVLVMVVYEIRGVFIFSTPEEIETLFQDILSSEIFPVKVQKKYLKIMKQYFKSVVFVEERLKKDLPYTGNEARKLLVSLTPWVDKMNVVYQSHNGETIPRVWKGSIDVRIDQGDVVFCLSHPEDYKEIVGEHTHTSHEISGGTFVPTSHNARKTKFGVSMYINGVYWQCKDIVDHEKVHRADAFLHALRTSIFATAQSEIIAKMKQKVSKNEIIQDLIQIYFISHLMRSF